MKVEDLISEYIPPLKYTETGERALNWMNEFRVSHLPVLHGNDYVGLVSDDDIFDMADPQHQLKDELINKENKEKVSNVKAEWTETRELKDVINDVTLLFIFSVPPSVRNMLFFGLYVA